MNPFAILSTWVLIRLILAFFVSDIANGKGRGQLAWFAFTLFIGAPALFFVVSVNDVSGKRFFEQKRRVIRINIY